MPDSTQTLSLTTPPHGPATESHVLGLLRIATTRHRGAVTVAELGWVAAAEIEWAHQGDPGPQVVVDPTPRDLAVLRCRLAALHRQGLAAATDDVPRRWRPASDTTPRGTHQP